MTHHEKSQHRREYLVIIRDTFVNSALKHMTPHLNRLNETTQMRGQNMVYGIYGFNEK